MKKYFTPLLLLFFAASFAQKADYEYITLKFKMPPVYPIAAGTTYRTNVNYVLHYNDCSFNGDAQRHFCDGAPTFGVDKVCKMIKNPTIILAAKYLNTDQADYTIELDMPGLIPGDTSFRKSNDIGNKLGKLDFSKFNTDFVMNWDFTMPAVLVAKNKQGQVVGTMPIIPADKKFSTVVHKYYFINAYVKDNGSSQSMPDNIKNDTKVGTEVGFEKQRQFNDFMRDYETQVLKREEAILANVVFDTVEKVLKNAYGETDFASQIAIGKVKVKKGDATFADLDTAFAYISSSAEALRKGKGTYDDLLRQWEAARKIYEDALVKNTSRLNDDIKNMLYNNLAFMNIFLGNIEQGDKYMAMHKEGMLGGHKNGYNYHRNILALRKNCPKLF
jgi:hypothetical protein